MDLPPAPIVGIITGAVLCVVIAVAGLLAERLRGKRE